MRDDVLRHLKALVSFRTENPPRDITEGHELFVYLGEALGPSFDVEITDHGEGCVSLFATRGAPKLLFNFHVDTVPAAEGYTGSPWELRIDRDRAVGLGACDIKGASAAMLAALQRDPEAPVALLFTSDEEHGSSRCVREFCQGDLPFELVVVAEPTEARAVTGHRGIFTGTASFRGRPGHASSGNADRDSAVHHAVRWCASALDVAASHEDDSFGSMRGMRLNLGRIEGGVKPNMIAEEASVRFGFRPLPGVDGGPLFDELATGAPDGATISPGFVAPSLPAPGSDDAVVREQVAAWGLPLGGPVDFWTEAALFSDAGYPTVVFGPGDIAQAHTVDEWVAIEQLERAASAYSSILESLR